MLTSLKQIFARSNGGRQSLLVLACLFLPVAPSLAQAPPLGPTQKTQFITANSDPSSLKSRLSALRQLSIRLPAADTQALLEFACGPRQETIPPRFWHAFVNDILDLLLRQQALPAGMEDGLVSMARENKDPVLQDYAIQKLDLLVSRSRSETTQALVFKTLQDAATLPGSNSQGTALLSWQRLLQKPDASFEKALAGCLLSAESTVAARLSALQAGTAAQSKETPVAAREILKRRMDPPTLILSAISALGTTGEPEDSGLISEFSEFPYYRLAVSTALRGLSAKAPPAGPLAH